MTTPAAAEPVFDPETCGACGSRDAAVALQRPAPSFASDGRVVGEPIVKLECLACGAVRRGTPFDARDLARYYRDEYALGRRAAGGEPLFFDDAGAATPRSAAVFSWLAGELRQCAGREPDAFAEIGCGNGAVLDRFRAIWRLARAVGLEWNRDDAAAARGRGLDVECAPYGALSGAFDVIYSVAVIEHVPSPAHFLATLGARLTPDGLLAVAFPSQDTGSRDVLFVDHLHHFHDVHVAHLGRAAGLATVRTARGRGALAAFRLHIFRRDPLAPAPDAVAPHAPSSSRAILESWARRFGRVDEWLATLDRPPIVWGLGETFGLFSAYSRLSAHRIRLGLDDNPARFRGDVLPFPVCRLEEAPDDSLRDGHVLLMFPGTPEIAARLERRSLPWFDALAGEVGRC